MNTYKKGMGTFRVDRISRDDIPASQFNFNQLHKISRWQWLRDEVSKLAIDGPVLRVRCPNKLEMERARSSVGTYKNTQARYPFLPAGAQSFTRCEPVQGKDGEYYLYIGLMQSTKEKAR